MYLNEKHGHLLNESNLPNRVFGFTLKSKVSFKHLNCIFIMYFRISFVFSG